MIKDAISSIRRVQYERANNTPNTSMNDPLARAAQYRPYLAEGMKRIKDVQSWRGFSGIAADRQKAAILTAKVGGGFDPAADVVPGMTEAVAVRLKSLGWTPRHKSKSGGKITSRYLVSPDKSREVRLSDHELPTRSLDEDISGRYRRGQDVVIGRWEAKYQTVDDIVKNIIDSIED